jgi:nitrite reductase/ring-hydroxylating ferredoxin subunit
MFLNISKIIAFTLLILTTSCKDEFRGSNIPSVPVNLFISLQDPEFIDLTTPTGWVYVTGGSRGIIIYRVNQDEFKAYDRHCTFDPTSSCGIIDMDVSNVTLSDACCGSIFSVFSGIPNQGPAVQRLREYTTTFDGNSLSVFNQ